jgi:LysR family transcriptional regulator, nitrogen assimilation regulatory protein
LIFEDLRAFVVVARHGSFAQAAADLCIAQSALSKRVQRLEHGMGAALLERHARGVTLTQAGHTFLARAHRLVDEVSELERNLSSFVQTPAGEVRIALPQRTCGLLAPPVVERCRRELPLVNLQVLEGTPSNVHGWLMRGETDIAMTYNSDLGSGFSVKPFLVEPLYLFASAQFGKPVPATCSLSDLASLPLILPRKPHVVRVLVDRLSAGQGVRPHIVYETDGPTTIRGMVERGMGVTIFSLSTSWSYAVEAGQLVAVPFASPLVNWKMYLACTRRDVGAIAIRRVYEIVEQELELLLNSGAWPNARRIPADAASADEPSVR